MTSKRTKIVATVGPASDSLETIEALAKEGVNVFRLNFSHGTHEYHKSTLDKVRQAEKNLGIRLGILQDICGPKIRVGKLENPFELKAGDKLIVVKDDIIGVQVSQNEYKLSINHPEISNLIKEGEYIYLYDGMIRAKVIKVADQIETIIENDGVLNSNKGVNFPNTKLNIEVITDKDKKDLEWGAKNGVDFVAVSFVQNAKDVQKAKDLIKEFGGHAKVFAKIEKFDAVENIDEIVRVSDGIMVARGDLGIEVPYYKVPSIQKSIIRKANEANKPVITATQMMLSMAKNESATRAEISDVANAVLDGTDAVMLSEESAVGINPVAVVRAMSATIAESEKIYPYGKFDEFSFVDETDMVASSTSRLATRIGVCAIVSITSSGQSAVKMARNRPNMDIIAVTHDEETARSLTIVWGVKPSLVIQKSRLNILLANTIQGLYKKGLISDECTYIMTAGYPTGAIGSTNFIRILKKDQIDYYLDAAI
ncbi:pyruvate kinase [Campylobacter hyointestinalis]|uniref:Pyruvate kinase n=1 Tax=Campylobacter hyointestinalis subsp. hyointestinalis TaxID=91352 RepID=A0A9W5AM95_CAMHY|nr:pyruvate kinase [Campylobacter hyointestinalis]PPB51554.1 pyruvate kinase [Campylobacter hyointestinalis subsp. hyointestinalis]PPB58830.1 pyruvate kinase [Campylobacter hyointestinalis subsp. hyointestinalis]PPB70339.1 pyruvate kinase [Campylobacter hyointestinalis subsp. hyointestinalis]PPB73441.1 pyruvate kinase [Campylobacter hyointestinalis subsp. hyointestinalis]PPB75652.1 pyruvate kinase [Campylobacter hyointestinalis subsp. hyointestinalis]